MKWTLEPLFIGAAAVLLVVFILASKTLAAVMTAAVLCFWAVSKVMR